MVRIDKLVNHDRISIGLLAATLFSCLVALTVAATPTPASIPERLLDRMRGANPAYYRYPDSTIPNCNALEVAELAENGTDAVPWNGCTDSTFGWLCITCAQQYNYDLKRGTGNPDVYPRPIQAVSCNVANDGSISGECVISGGSMICFGEDEFDCDVLAASYNTEP